MLPYLQIAPLDLGFAHVYPFALLVAMGVVTGHLWAVRESKTQGLMPRSAAEMGAWMVAVAFFCSWLFRMAYQAGWPHGITAFGGIFGGLLGAWLYRRRSATAEPLLRYLDLFTCAFLIGWIFGRTGCSIAHDHLGRRSSEWFAVASPDGGRFDLGLIELAFTILIVPAMIRLNRAPHPPGLTLGVFLIIYGPFRVILDQLHENPPRWLFWSVDQWTGSMAALCGIGFIAYSFSTARRGAAQARGRALEPVE